MFYVDSTSGIRVDDLPKGKAEFDATFFTTTDNKNNVWIKFQVTSKDTFASIRTICAPVLKKLQGVKLSLQPKVLSPKKKYEPIGFWTNILARGINRNVFYHELQAIFQKQYEEGRKSFPALPAEYKAQDFYLSTISQLVKEKFKDN